jgi:hypothetical protein
MRKLMEVEYTIAVVVVVAVEICKIEFVESSFPTRKHQKGNSIIKNERAVEFENECLLSTCCSISENQGQAPKFNQITHSVFNE